MRLTTDNAVENMDMMELAHNSCYAKDRKARYRDYDMDMDARDFARNLMSTLTNDELPLDDVSFDEEVLENLQYDCFSDIRGLIALFYRNLWAMADLRETLKVYEDLEEQCIAENQCGLRELLLKWKEFFDDIAALYDYRKAEEQGLLLRLPAAVGSKFWYLNGKFILDFVVTGYHVCEKIEEGIIFGEHYNEYDDKTYCHSFDVDKIGKTVFLTREEAEAALAEKGGVE